VKIEKISENQIRCTLTSEDLDARNIRLNDLAYGSEQTRKLFREMMREADLEVGFHSQGAPLMVEAIPTSSDSIMLIITRVDDPDELDARFSRFTRPRNDLSGDISDQDDSESAEDPVPFQADRSEEAQTPTDAGNTSSDDNTDKEAQGLEELFHRLFEALGRKEDSSQPDGSSAQGNGAQAKKAGTADSAAAGGASAADSTDTVSTPAENGKVSSVSAHTPDDKAKAGTEESRKEQPAAERPRATCGFEFTTLDSVIEAAHSPAGSYHGRSILYRRPDRHGSYLLIVHENSSPSEYASVCGILSEYGHPLRISQAREAWFAEHADTLIRAGALSKLMNV
jgi:adapter protein MecA 1/2